MAVQNHLCFQVSSRILHEEMLSWLQVTNEQGVQTNLRIFITDILIRLTVCIEVFAVIIIKNVLIPSITLM